MEILSKECCGSGIVLHAQTVDISGLELYFARMEAAGRNSAKARAYGGRRPE